MLSLNAQQVKVESLGSKDYELLQHEGWDLEFTSAVLKFSQFGVNAEGKVLISKVDKGYQLTLLNNENLITKSKTVKFDIYKMREGVPILYSHFRSFMFGPSKGKYLEIQIGKENFKGHRYPASMRKNKRSIPLMYKLNENNEKAGSAVFSKEENKLSVFLVDYSASPYDTLYWRSHNANEYVVNSVNPSIQFLEIDSTADIILINNKSGELLLIGSDEGIVKNINLSDYYFNRSKYSKDYSCKLLQDGVTGYYYLYYNPLGSEGNRLFKIETFDFALSEMEISKLASHNLQVHDSKLYDLFYIEELEANAIYSKFLE